MWTLSCSMRGSSSLTKIEPRPLHWECERDLLTTREFPQMPLIQLYSSFPLINVSKLSYLSPFTFNLAVSLCVSGFLAEGTELHPVLFCFLPLNMLKTSDLCQCPPSSFATVVTAQLSATTPSYSPHALLCSPLAPQVLPPPGSLLASSCALPREPPT